MGEWKGGEGGGGGGGVVCGSHCPRKRRRVNITIVCYSEYTTNPREGKGEEGKEGKPISVTGFLLRIWYKSCRTVILSTVGGEWKERKERGGRMVLLGVIKIGHVLTLLLSTKREIWEY